MPIIHYILLIRLMNKPISLITSLSSADWLACFITRKYLLCNIVVATTFWQQFMQSGWRQLGRWNVLNSLWDSDFFVVNTVRKTDIYQSAPETATVSNKQVGEEHCWKQMAQVDSLQSHIPSKTFIDRQNTTVQVSCFTSYAVCTNWLIARDDLVCWTLVKSSLWDS